MMKTMGTGHLRGRSSASSGASAGLLGFRRRCSRFALGLCLRLAPREDFDFAETGHHELDRVALLATLIVPGARTYLTDEPEAGARLNGLFDQGDLRGCEHNDAVPVGFLVP